MGVSRLSDIGEFELIDRIALIAGPSTAVMGIGDDAAVLHGPVDRYLLATVDMQVEGTHFRLAGTTPEIVGATALAVNISDIAAMGGEPCYALVSLAAAQDTESSVIEQLFEGLTREAASFGVSLVGGNLTRIVGPLAIDVVLLGEVPRDEVVLRRGAVAGDILAVTGSLGGRTAVRLARERGSHNNTPQTSPVPRVQAGRALASNHLAHAMMDISDGLGGDLVHICAASGVGAVVFDELLPISTRTREIAADLDLSPERLALDGGDDYELLVALSPEDFEQAVSAVGEIGLTRIGTIVNASEGIVREAADGMRHPLEEAGWRHF